MHKIDIDTVEMTLDVMKYAISRITNQAPELGKPRKEEELGNLVGKTITPDGIGGERAFELFRDVLVKATVPIDHPRHLAFVPAAPVVGVSAAKCTVGTDACVIAAGCERFRGKMGRG